MTAVPSLLARWGIRCVFLPHRQKTYLDGAALWLDEVRRHPGIVLGRLQSEHLVPYRNLRFLLVKVSRV